jgi:transcriptional regulator with XRE-family HTH domain
VGARSQTSEAAPAYEAFGAFVRAQRELARLTLRQASELARISNPYLSQIEHGLSLPSITVLGALAEALSVSVETLLLQAAGVARSSSASCPPRTEDAIRLDPRLSNMQKSALLTVLASFTAERLPDQTTYVVPEPASAEAPVVELVTRPTVQTPVKVPQARKPSSPVPSPQSPTR